MDEYDLCNQPKREARREVVKKDLCEKGYKKRTQQNRILVVVRKQKTGKQSEGLRHPYNLTFVSCPEGSEVACGARYFRFPSAAT